MIPKSGPGTVGLFSMEHQIWVGYDQDHIGQQEGAGQALGLVMFRACFAKSVCHKNQYKIVNMTNILNTIIVYEQLKILQLVADGAILGQRGLLPW